MRSIHSNCIVKRGNQVLFPGSSKKPKIFCRKALTNPVFIDGVARVGKNIIALVASSFERAEHIQGQPMIDSLFLLHGMGLIDSDAALDLLRKEVNNYLMLGQLGRHINTNLYDYTGVWNSRMPDVYLKRLLRRDTPETYLQLRAAMRRDTPILLLHSHEILCDCDLFLKGFQDSRIVSVFRHPVDVVFSWQRKGFGERYGKDLRAGAHTVWGVKGPVPWWAFDWAEEYENLQPIERVMKSVAVLNARCYDRLDRMPTKHRNRLLPLCFEHFVRDPEPMVAALADFLGTRPTSVKAVGTVSSSDATMGTSTEQVLRKQRLPRKLDRVEFKRRFQLTRENSSRTTFEVFVEDCLRYEKRFRPGISIRRLL